MAYLNGRLPASALGYISGTNERLLKELVPQTEALRDAFKKHFGKSLGITDAYRDYATQVRLKAEKGAFAATPGTSNHGWGRAIDFGSGVHIENSAEYKWMKANAPRYGWTHPRWAEDNNPKNGQQEPWHWEATVVPVSNYTPIGGDVPSVPNPTTPTPVTPKDWFDMATEAQLTAIVNNAVQPLMAEIGRIGQRLKEIEVVDEWVRTWYPMYLGRAATSADTDYWTRFVADGHTLAQVLSNIAGSDEAKGARTKAAINAYITELGRLPESDARVAAWAQSPQTLDDLRKAIAATPEGKTFAALPKADREKKIAAAQEALKKAQAAVK